MKEIKETKESVGIDVSKKTIDVYLYVRGLSAQFSNDKKGFKELLLWVKKNSGVDPSHVAFCFEHTGIYSMCLADFLNEIKVLFVIVPGLEIKKSLGMARGKNDKVDAKRIAEYLYLRRHQLKQTVLPARHLIQIKALLALRDRMVKQKAGYEAALKEMKIAFPIKELPQLFKAQEKILNTLAAAILEIEEKVHNLIIEDEEMKRIYKLLNSIKGIGPVVAAHLLVITNVFTAFQNSRQLACYCGVAQFENQSGTSLKSNSKVSHMANKKLKSLITMSAMSAIQHDPEIRQYYNRRIENGKSSFSTINTVKNKLLHRAFAVVKRGTPYVNIQKWAA
jgi:transposase